MGLTATARAKLLLTGEHAAVYGAPAVGLALPWTLRATWQAAPAWDLPGLGPWAPAVRQVLDELGRQADQRHRPPLAPGLLTFHSEIPPGSGFGSSGALCAALTNLAFPDLPLAERDVIAWTAEALFHGTPSGIDTALALREGWWVLDPSVRPVRASALADPGLTLLVGSLRRDGDTKALVGGLARRRAAGEAVVVDALDELSAVSRATVDLLVGGGPGTGSGLAPALAPLLTRAREALRRLDLETPTLTAVLEAGLGRPGALAGKLSGAGGGGAFLLVFRDQASAEAAVDAVTAAVAAGDWTAPPRVVTGTD